MKLYQAGYFRKGKQGYDAGWNIVSPSEGMSKTAKDGFQGIAANLTELKQKGSMPVTNQGLFFHDRFVYFMHVNYAAAGEDARGVTFVHGYCFNMADYYELCSEPSRIFGLKEDNFRMEYDEKIKAYPVEEGLPFSELNYQVLLGKYQFTDEEYRKLILGALCAIDGYSDPLCIKLSLPLEDYQQAYCEILYLIMEGLPFHLRIKISCFSYKGAKAAIYVSDAAEGNNYADLDAREFSCDTSRLESFHFTRIYNTVSAKDVATREHLLKAIAQFMDDSFENPLKETGCSQVEAGFQAKIKKNNGGIVPGMALELLQSFTSYSLTKSQEAYDYMAELLRLINEENAILDTRTNDRLMGFYEQKANTAFHAEMDRYYVSTLFANGRHGYKLLFCLRKKSERQYRAVCELIKKCDEEYYQQYREEEYLPGILTDLETIRSYVAKQDLTTRDYLVILKLFTSFIRSEIEDADDFEELLLLERESREILLNFPEDLRDEEVAHVADKVYDWIWERFDLQWFDPEKSEDYKVCELERIAAKGRRDGLENNATLVCDLLLLLENNFEPDDGRQVFSFLRDLFLSDQITADRNTKEKLRKILRKEFIKTGNWGMEDGFDISLCFYYNDKEKRFDSIHWCKDCYGGKGWNYLFLPERVKQWERRSKLLRNSKWRDCFADSLEAGIKAAKKGEGGLSKGQIKGLKYYYDCLMGKEIEKSNRNEGVSFAYSLHRIFIGFMTLVSTGIGLRSIFCYSTGWLHTVAWILSIVFLTAWLVVFVLKFFYLKDKGGILGNAGISFNDISKPILYVGVIILLAGAGAVIFFLSRSFPESRFAARLISVVVTGTLALISTLGYFILGEE